MTNVIFVLNLHEYEVESQLLNIQKVPKLI